MTSFHLRSLDGNDYHVNALDESSARHAVMLKRWGLPRGIYALNKDGRYQGRGLLLQEPK